MHEGYGEVIPGFRAVTLHRILPGMSNTLITSIYSAADA